MRGHTREDPFRLLAWSTLFRRRGTRRLAAYTPASRSWCLRALIRPEMKRSRGELTRDLPDDEGAEQCFAQ